MLKIENKDLIGRFYDQRTSWGQSFIAPELLWCITLWCRLKACGHFQRHKSDGRPNDRKRRAKSTAATYNTRTRQLEMNQWFMIDHKRAGGFFQTELIDRPKRLMWMEWLSLNAAINPHGAFWSVARSFGFLHQTTHVYGCVIIVGHFR